MKYASLSYKRAGLAKGYTDRLLHINFSNYAIAIESIPAEVKKIYVGGRGYRLKLVYDGTTATTRYDSPENVLALSGGPFCGETGFVGTGKFIAGTISPLTNSEQRRRNTRAGTTECSRSGTPHRQRTRRTTAPLVER